MTNEEVIKQHVAEKIRQCLAQLEYHVKPISLAVFDLSELKAKIEAWISDRDTQAGFMEEALDFLRRLGVSVLEHQRAGESIERDVEKILAAISDERNERGGQIPTPEGLLIQ